jgi:hypothetical protein
VSAPGGRGVSANSLSTERACGLPGCAHKAPDDRGLHKHLRSAHGVSAWDYYGARPEALLSRLRHDSDVVVGPTAEAIGPCWIHRGVPDGNGYSRARVAGAPTSAAHRLSYWAVMGELPRYGCHACDEPRCCSPLHIYSGTPEDNARDRKSKGRSRGGGGDGGGGDRALNAEQHLDLVIRSASEGVLELAERFGLGPHAIRRALAWPRVAETVARYMGPEEILW